jgi:hypothetical protein
MKMDLNPFEDLSTKRQQFQHNMSNVSSKID